MQKYLYRLLVVLSICAGWACPADAAGDSFDLNLKELRPSAPHAAPLQHKAPQAEPVSSGSSRYTVRPGDHLFLILTRQYRLSERAAEQLIPEVLRLNNIRNPHGLVIGRQLTIPLPAPAANTTKNVAKPALSHATSRHAGQPPAAAAVSVPAAAPAVQEQAFTAASQRRATIAAAPPCQLARELADRLGVLIPSLAALEEIKGTSAGYGELKLVIACGLSSDEAYTFQRLLARHDAQLLVFRGDEAPRLVVEGLAGGLGMPFQLVESDGHGELPLTYFFPAGGPYEQDVSITIR